MPSRPANANPRRQACSHLGNQLEVYRAENRQTALTVQGIFDAGHALESRVNAELQAMAYQNRMECQGFQQSAEAATETLRRLCAAAQAQYEANRLRDQALFSAKLDQHAAANKVVQAHEHGNTTRFMEQRLPIVRDEMGKLAEASDTITEQRLQRLGRDLEEKVQGMQQSVSRWMKDKVSQDDLHSTLAQIDRVKEQLSYMQTEIDAIKDRTPVLQQHISALQRTKSSCATRLPVTR